MLILLWMIAVVESFSLFVILSKKQKKNKNHESGDEMIEIGPTTFLHSNNTI
jgi:hypothetical protein